MKQQWALLSSGYQCPQQQKVHQVCCYYQARLITAITDNQGRAARHLLVKEKSQCRAAQITSATVNTLPSAVTEIKTTILRMLIYSSLTTPCTLAPMLTLSPWHPQQLHTCGLVHRYAAQSKYKEI